MLSSEDVCQRKMADTEESVYTRKAKAFRRNGCFEKEAAYDKEDFFFGREKLFVKQQWGDEKESRSSGRRFVKKNI